MTIILWKIIIVSILLIETVLVASLGWRVLTLLQRVKQIQSDRNEMDEERRKLSDKLRLKGIEIDQLKKEMCSDIMFRTIKEGAKVIGELLSDLEKKMILAALNMSEYGKAIQNPKTNFQVRKTYRDLKEKIKASFDD
jgi:hypothetical protein